MLGGDFNNIGDHEEKNGGRRRQEGSFWGFRNFIADMEIGEVKFRGHVFTWLNNRENKGLIDFLDQLNG